MVPCIKVESTHERIHDTSRPLYLLDTLILSLLVEAIYLIWMLPKMEFFPPNHPLKNRVFHDFNHPLWGVSAILGNPHIFLLNLDSLFRSVMAFERCRCASASERGLRDWQEEIQPPATNRCRKNTLSLEQVYGKREKHICILHIYIYVISLISVLIEGYHLSFEHVEVL